MCNKILVCCLNAYLIFSNTEIFSFKIIILFSIIFESLEILITFVQEFNLLENETL